MNDAVFLSVVAFSIVILVLGAMALLMRGLGWSVSKATLLRDARQPRDRTDEPPVRTVAPAGSDEVDDETVAAVTAAVTMMMDGSRFNVTGIRPVADERPGWVVQGPGGVPDSSDRWRSR